MTMRRLGLPAVALMLCVSTLAHAADRRAQEGAASGKDGPERFTLALGRQGQSVGLVDVDGDGIDDKIVGAPFAASSTGPGDRTGALLVYAGDSMGGFSAFPTMLLAGDDNYGFTFLNMGDVDGDGRDDFAAGAVNGDGKDVSLSGSVTVYRGGRNWNYDRGFGKIIAKLSGEGALDKFGASLSSGDLNGDGLPDLVAGAPFATNDPAVYQGGAVHVCFAPDFSARAILHASLASKSLGWSAAVGDINADGIADLCISAAGKVLCYYGGPGFDPRTDEPDVKITGTAAGFGKAIAIVGDLNGDGFGDIVIGAPNAVVGGNRDTGSVYIVNGGTGKRTVNADAPTSGRIVRIDGAALFNRFGSSIVPVGDIDGDRKPDFAIGAPMADADALTTLSGKVYLFKGKDINGATTLAGSTVFRAHARDLGYGTSLAATRDGRLLIGAPRADGDIGAVFMVDLATGQDVPEGGSGGLTGGSDDCH